MTLTDDTPAPAPVAMDPRIRQRRQQVRRDEGRRRLRVVVAGLGAMVVAGSGYALTRSPLLDVDRVKVLGPPDRAADVVAAAGIATGTLMTELEIGAVERNVEALPWVASAEAVRAWPGTVAVRVRARPAVAAVPAPLGMWADVDAAGRVLSVQATPPRRPVVRGDAEAPEPGALLDPTMRAGVATAAALPTRLRVRVSQIEIVDGEVQLLLATKERVRVGAADALAQKVLALETVLAKADLRGVSVIDVRVPSAPALTRG